MPKQPRLRIRKRPSRTRAGFSLLAPLATPALALLAVVAAPASAQDPPPPRGTPGAGPPSAAERQNRPGPWDNDILVYRVAPGGAPEHVATFERAGVATIARLAGGRLIAAHQHFPEHNEADFDKVALRFSEDEGRSWSGPAVMRLSGLPEGMRFPFDPTLVPLPDGRIRMYFTSLMGRRFDEASPAIYSAISEDGVHYTFEPGMRFGVEGRTVIDCAVVLHGKKFHLFSPDNGVGLPPGGPGGDRRPEGERAREGVGYHAVSRDGLHFKRRDDVEIAGERRWLGSARSDGDTITFYGTGAGGVWTATSTNGKTWTPGPVLRGMRAADPGAVALEDGTLVIVGTGPPRTGGPAARPRPADSNPPRPPGPPDASKDPGTGDQDPP